MERGTFEGMTAGFSRTLNSTILSGPHVEISPHAVDWLAERQSSVMLNFRRKNHPLRCGLSSKFFDHLSKIQPHLKVYLRYLM